MSPSKFGKYNSHTNDPGLYRLYLFIWELNKDYKIVLRSQNTEMKRCICNDTQYRFTQVMISGNNLHTMTDNDNVSVPLHS